MPYTEIKKEKVDGQDKWCFHNKETGQRICADTHEKAVLAMRARYAHTHEMQIDKYLCPECNPMIKTEEDT